MKIYPFQISDKVVQKEEPANKDLIEPIDKVEAMQKLNMRQKSNMGWWTKIVLVKFGRGKYKSIDEIPDNVRYKDLTTGLTKLQI